MTTASAVTPSTTVSEQPEAKPARWEVNKCNHGHNYKTSRKVLYARLRNYQPHTKEKGQKVWHFTKCIRTLKQERKLKRVRSNLTSWRKTYDPRWRIKYNTLPSYGKSWAVSTGACESGNNPTTNTGNGYKGAFQWLDSTWYSAGGDRDPVAASWHHEAYLAWFWHLGHPSGQWPNCGE